MQAGQNNQIFSNRKQQYCEKEQKDVKTDGHSKVCKTIFFTETLNGDAKSRKFNSEKDSKKLRKKYHF